jgi:hypothetical protein
MWQVRRMNRTAMLVTGHLTTSSQTAMFG